MLAYALAFKPCSEATDRDYFTFRKLAVAAGVILIEGFFAFGKIWSEEGMKRGREVVCCGMKDD